MAIEVTSHHLLHVASPKVATPEEALHELQAIEERLLVRVEFAEAWRDRVPTREPAGESATLQELVTTARERLRDSRVAADTKELSARHQAVQWVKAGLGE